MDHGQKKRVLLVHDDPALTAALTKSFRALGFIADVAIDFRAAIRFLGKDAPDIVCVSLNLPRDSGYDLCDHIRKEPGLDAVRILVVSDRHSPEDIAYAEEAGANAFIRVPVSMGALEKLVKAMFDVGERARAAGPGLGLAERPEAE